MYGAGSERLRALDGPWFLGDALGSVRTTLDDDGAVVATASYDPWGTPQGDLLGPFGFTGELHHGEQVYLRARWYHPGSGTFTARDPFAGWAETPYSLHAYQYAYRAPTVWTDPSGAVAVIGFSPEEFPLVNETLNRFAALLGGVGAFERNVALKTIKKSPTFLDGSTSLNAFYLPQTETIVLPPNIYRAVAGKFPELGTHRFVIVTEARLCEIFPDLPQDTVPNQEAVFQFVLAHEMTHALVWGNPSVLESFSNTFWRDVPIIDLPILRYFTRSEPIVNDRSVERNRGRRNFKEEVLSDAIAGYLYVPKLLGATYDAWIEHVLPRLMR